MIEMTHGSGKNKTTVRVLKCDVVRYEARGWKQAAKTAQKGKTKSEDE